MIDSKKKLKFYIKADAIMNEQVFPQTRLKRLLFPSIIEKFLRTMRKLEYYKNTKTRCVLAYIPFLYYKRKYEALKVRTGFDIPPNTFGYGLRIGHLSTIVINNATKIGNYCSVANNLVIADGHRKVIGNCVQFGSNVVICKKLSIADGCKLSSCSLLNRSIKDKNMLWGG